MRSRSRRRSRPRSTPPVCATEESPFDGRSDYKPFQDNGVAAGGLFTGAEGVKTPAQATKFGGIANVAFDPNYHQAGDDLGNVNATGYEQMTDAAAIVVGGYATDRGDARAVPADSTRPRGALPRVGEAQPARRASLRLGELAPGERREHRTKQLEGRPARPPLVRSAGSVAPPCARVLMGLQFFPRGGSAHVARNLARNLPAAGWEPTARVRVAVDPGPPRRRARVLRGARRAARRHDRGAGVGGPDARRGAAAPVLRGPARARRTACSPRSATTSSSITSTRGRARSRARAADADVLHLHHLTPLNAAAARVAPDVPVVGHLHGTELLMLEAIEDDPAPLGARPGVGGADARRGRRAASG